MDHAARDMFDLAGRVALITGAGQGVGRAIAGVLGAFGARVAVNDFHSDRATRAADELKAVGIEAMPVVADVSDLDQVRGGVEAAERALGPIAILVNNAGNFGADVNTERHQLFWETDPARWRRYIDVNLYGVMNCCHAVLPSMVGRGYGRIVTIVSDAARNIEARGADYAAGKAGAAGFMRGVAADAARFGVTANCVALATILPDRPAGEIARFMASERTKRQLTRYAIRRFGRAEDVVGTVLMLCSDAAAWTTGQTYAVNGGYSSTL